MLVIFRLKLILNLNLMIFFISNFHLDYTIDEDDCALTDKPCSNHGECTDLVNGFSCKCADGYTGDRCETGELLCLSSVR